MVVDGFFNIEKFLIIIFKLYKLVFEGDKVVVVEGDFMLFGVIKLVKLVVSNFKCGLNLMNKKEMCGVEISIMIKCSDFGMIKYVLVIGDDIKIIFLVEVYKN